MTRLLTLALVALLGDAPAPPPATPPADNRTVFDLRDWGGIPNDDLPDDDAHERLKAALGPARDARGTPIVRTILLRGGTFDLTWPYLHSADFVRYQSPDGSGFRAGGCGPLALVDRDSFKGVSITPDHSFPLDGLLDSSVPAGKVGIQSQGNAHVASWDGPYDVGPKGGWESVDDLTADFILFGDLDDGQLCGLFDYGDGAVWYVYTRKPDLVGIIYATPNKQVGRLSFVAPKGPDGLRRISVRTSPGKRIHSAWVNGMGVPLASSGFPATDTTLRRNEVQAWQWFNTGERVSSTIAGPEPRLAMVGPRLTVGPIYAEDGPGAPQRRADGIKVNDLNRFFFVEPGKTFALMDHDAATAARPGNRWVGIRSADRTPGYAAWFSPAMGGSGVGMIGSPQYVGVRLEGRGLGTPLALCRAADLLVRDCQVVGGYTGIGGPSFGANYPATVEDTQVSGQAGYCLSFTQTIVACRGLRLNPTAGVARLIESDFALRDSFSAAPAAGLATFRVIGGANANSAATTVSNFSFDSEGAVAPGEAFLSIRRRGAGSPILAELDRVTIAQLGRQAALVKVDDSTTAKAPAGTHRVAVRSTWVQSPVHRCTLDAPADPSWIAEVDVIGRPAAELSPTAP